MMTNSTPWWRHQIESSDRQQTRLLKFFRQILLPHSLDELRRRCKYLPPGSRKIKIFTRNLLCAWRLLVNFICKQRQRLGLRFSLFLCFIFLLSFHEIQRNSTVVRCVGLLSTVTSASDPRSMCQQMSKRARRSQRQRSTGSTHWTIVSPTFWASGRLAWNSKKGENKTKL